MTTTPEPTTADYRTVPPEIAPGPTAWQAWWEDFDSWDGYLLYADLDVAKHHSAVAYVGEEYSWIAGDDPADEAPDVTLTWEFEHQRWHLLDDGRNTGVQLYVSRTYAAPAVLPPVSRAAAERVVAYRSPGTRALYCVTCARQESGWKPATAEVQDDTVCDFCGECVLAVAAPAVSLPVSRAAVLREAADAVARLIDDGEHDPDCLVYELRSMASTAEKVDEEQPEPVSPAYERLKDAASKANADAATHAMHGIKRVFQLARRHGTGSIPAAEVLAALGLDENANTVVRRMADEEQPAAACICTEDAWPPHCPCRADEYRAAAAAPADKIVAAMHVPCSFPPCNTDGTGEPCDRHEQEQAHTDGFHEDCGVTCEVQYPSEQLRNFLLAKGYPGSAGMLDELLRRAAAAPAGTGRRAVAELPETLIRYLAERDTQRAENVDAVVAALTERERRLVREAAVMAYVQGLMRDRAEGCPNDAVVLGLVVDACLAAPDLYPVISGVLPCSECAHPQYAHKDGEDPVSPGACLACDAEDSDDAHHDYVPVPHDSGQDTDGEAQR